MKRLEKGFTLIELMIVVAIIGILAAVAAPKFGQQIQKARDSKALALVGTWRSASNIYYADKFEYAPTMIELKEFVDESTQKQTYTTSQAAIDKDQTKDLETATTITSGTSVYFAAGTPKTIEALYTYISTGSSFDIKTTVDNTNGDAWDSL